MKNLGFILLSLVLVAQGVQAKGRGGIGDGGGEQLTAEANPWRVGPNPIEYCIQRADDFPQTKEALSHIVSESFQNWEEFFFNHHMNQNFQGNSDKIPAVGLPSSAREVESCTHPKSQIRFVFGMLDSELSLYRSYYDDRTIGFAHRTNYDLKTFQGSGVVWIAPQNAYPEETGAIETIFPNWNWEVSLKHQVLHEIGHIFGMPHNSTWVMDEGVMFTQLWATLRHQYDSESKDSVLLPLGRIETLSQIFDPLSGISFVTSCPGFACWLSAPMPAIIQKALKIHLSDTMNHPLVTLKFSQTIVPNPVPANEPPPPTFKMTFSMKGKLIEKTVDLEADKLEYDFVPRLYLSGAYNPEVAYLRRVYNGTFKAKLVSEGVTIPMIVIVRNNFIKLSIFDSTTSDWQDWLTISPVTVRDQNSPR